MALARGLCRHAAVTSARTVRARTSAANVDVPGTAGATRVVVIGAGAAGLLAACFAAEAGAQVTLLERTKEAGKKILMSGGTRCNVLPVEVNYSEDFFSESPASAVRAVLASWPLDDCRAWLEDTAGIALEMEEETNKWFPASNSSREVRDKLVRACLQRGVQIQYDCSVEGLRPLPPTPELLAQQQQQQQQQQGEGEASAASTSRGGLEEEGAPSTSTSTSTSGGGAGGGKKRKVAPAFVAAPNGGWGVRLQGKPELKTDRVVIATGGLSFPAVGTDGTGHRILRQLGHSMVEPYPALTPLTGSHPAGQQLAGLSLYNVDLRAQLPGRKKGVRATRTGFLFTHRGWSGPSVLDLSHHAVMAQQRRAEAPAMRVNWTGEPADVWEGRLKGGGLAMVSTVLQRAGVRERLADALCAEVGLPERARMSDLKRTERQALVQALTAYELRVTGSEGYKKAEVTGGGVPLTEVDCSSMESRLLPGLHLCGEVLDVFGRVGGFNFLWAWNSGRLAGRGAGQARRTSN